MVVVVAVAVVVVDGGVWRRAGGCGCYQITLTC